MVLGDDAPTKTKSQTKSSKSKTVKSAKHSGPKKVESAPSWQNQLRGPNEAHKSDKEAKQPLPKVTREPLSKRSTNAQTVVPKATKNAVRGEGVSNKDQDSKASNKVAQASKT